MANTIGPYGHWIDIKSAKKEGMADQEIAVALFPERWPSGLRCTIGNRVCGKPHRGFESLPLRLHIYFNPSTMEESPSEDQSTDYDLDGHGDPNSVQPITQHDARHVHRRYANE